MSVITTGNYPKLLWPGIHAVAMGTYNAHKTEYTHIFDVEKSKMRYEEDVEDIGFGRFPVKPEGQSITYQSVRQGFTKRYTAVAYASGYIATREEMKDNLYKAMMKRAKKLAFAAATTKETVAANVLNRGFNASYADGGDGKELFATDHPTQVGTFSNELATPADLSEASLEDLLIQVDETTDSNGLPVKVLPKCLVVPAALRFEASRILESTLTPGSENNAINVIKSEGLLPDGYKVNHYLTDADAWFIKTDAQNGMTMFEREAFTFERDNDFNTKNMMASGYMRFSEGWTDPRGMFGSEGAA